MESVFLPGSAQGAWAYPMAFQKVRSFPLPGWSLSLLLGSPWKPSLLFPKGDLCPAVTKRDLLPCKGSLGPEAHLLLAVSGTGDDSYSVFRTDWQKLSVL